MNGLLMMRFVFYANVVVSPLSNKVVSASWLRDSVRVVQNC